MKKIYLEHPVFDACSVFDTETGHLTTIDEGELLRLRPDVPPAGDTAPGVVRRDGAGLVAFEGEINPRRTRFPRRIYFQITRRCNLSCPYCFLEAGPGQAHVPTAAVLDMAGFCAANGLMEVRLTGGEPTTHPDFFEIVDAFRERGVYISVATNGVIGEPVVRGLAEREGIWVIVSLDGPREVHERYRPGTFDTILRRLRLLKELAPAIRLRLTSVLTVHNLPHIFELCRVERELGAESLTIIPLRPQVRDSEVIGEMVTASQFRWAVEEMVRAQRELGVKVTTTIETDFAAQFHRDLVFRKRAACAAGREATNLDYDAAAGRFQVYGCSYSPAADLSAAPAIRRPFLAGTFPTDRPADLLSIWRDDQSWQIFREDAFKAAECLDCEYLTRHQCVGSCPIQNVDYPSIDVSDDVLEQIRTQLGRTAEWYCYQRISPGTSG
jgi:MoaA/NifB/PqqE/SkfB family radical SAM enzyme